MEKLFASTQITQRNYSDSKKQIKKPAAIMIIVTVAQVKAMVRLSFSQLKFPIQFRILTVLHADARQFVAVRVLAEK